MHRKEYWLTARGLTLILTLVMMAVSAIAQDDPDPNSPTPILLTESSSIRALANRSGEKGRVDLNRLRPQAFAPGSTVDIYVTNLVLLPDEGPLAFRFYAVDREGRTYRFPVVDMERLTKGQTGVVRMSVALTDELKYWDQPAADGDVLVYLTWRGLASNFAKLGLGSVGGDIRTPSSAVPAPLGTVAAIDRNGTSRSLSPEYVGYRWSGDRYRFLQQTTFGFEPNLDSRLRRIGLRAWLAEQFDAPYPTPSNPYPNQPLKPANAPADCDGDQTVTPDVPETCFRDTYTMYPIQRWNNVEALYGSSQLRHRVAWALSQIWVTSGVDIQQSRHMVEYHKILSSNAFGNYRTLMRQMTFNPTMGDYLDMARSTKNNPNENYARELMQLFSVGLFMLNDYGQVLTDGSGNPIPTYDQNVVNNLTKVLTGWSFCQTAASCPNLTVGTVNFIDPLLLTTGNHDLTAKTLLSYTGSTTTNIAACSNCTSAANITTYANNSAEQALDNIFNHPNLPPFISKLLIQHLVTSDPSPEYVRRVALVFKNNGSGVRGDLKAVVKAILLDPEARGDVKTDPNYGKLREPFQYATNILRAFNVRSADGSTLSDGMFTARSEFTGMQQIPFRSPTVFNYYPPDYVVPGSALLGPEYALMTTGTSIQRANFVNRFVFTAPAVAVSNPDVPLGTSLDFSDLQALAQADTTGNQLVNELNQRMMYGTMSTEMKNAILTAVVNIPATSTANYLQRARQAVYLIATSSQYQVQR